MDLPKFIVHVSGQKEESITIKRVKFRLVPWQVLNVHYKQNKMSKSWRLVKDGFLVVVKFYN